MENCELDTSECSSASSQQKSSSCELESESVLCGKESSLQEYPVLSNEKMDDKRRLDELSYSFVKAVNEKYNDESNDSPTEINGLYLPKSGPVDVTESGTILLPRQLSMSGWNICLAGDSDIIRCMCPRVEELDLMSNDIQSWEEVFTILEGSPELNFLNLSQNKISSSLPDLSDRPLPDLKRLVLNDTKVSWKVLLRLLEVFPNIEELHLSVNDFCSFDIPSSTPPYTSLQHLFFVGNKITDWREINRIGAFFPKLESFMLSETKLGQFTGADEIPTSFPCLKILGLNRTHLESWEEVEKLRKFPQLTDVRLRFIPFLESQPKDILRNHTIAILPKVTLLNQTPISENEREDAERAYIRLYMDDEERPARYDELEKIHGKLLPLWPLSLKPKNSVKVIVKVEEYEDDDKAQKLMIGEEMEIDVKMTMKELRKMLSNVASHPASKIHLYHVDKEGGSWTNRMLYPNRKVLAYKVQDGDEIIAVKLP